MSIAPMNPQTKLILRIIGAILLIVSVCIFIEIITPDSKSDFDPKPNLEEELKPIKEQIAFGLLILSGLLLAVSFLPLGKRRN